MRRRLLAIALTIIAIALLTKNIPSAPAPNAPRTFSFAVLGDAPYSGFEELQQRLVLRTLDAENLRFVIHVGDIFWYPCTDEHYVRTRDQWNALRHPVIYTPGDNEWTDCWETGSEGFAPLERLARLRRLFFASPERSLGRRRIALVSQSRQTAFGEFVEHARWQHDGVTFATVHLVGSRNAMKPFPGRDASDDDAATRRTEAAVAWIRATFAEARNTNARAVVIAFHANASLEKPAGDPYRLPYESFIAVIGNEAVRFRRPVLLVHGDGHVYLVDHPLARAPNVIRMQVPGSPDVGWVRVVVTRNAAAPFAFENHVVPRWHFW